MNQPPSDHVLRFARSKRQYPHSHHKLVWHWADRLMGMRKVHDIDVLVNPRYGIHDARLIAVCFACGNIHLPEIAHIKPRHMGGNDEPDNLHILCHACHEESEFLSGDAYWRWFRAKEFKSDIRRRFDTFCIALGADNVTEASVIIHNIIGIRGSMEAAAEAVMERLGMR